MGSPSLPVTEEPAPDIKDNFKDKIKQEKKQKRQQRQKRKSESERKSECEKDSVDSTVTDVIKSDTQLKPNENQEVVEVTEVEGALQQQPSDISEVTLAEVTTATDNVSDVEEDTGKLSKQEKKQKRQLQKSKRKSESEPEKNYGYNRDTKGRRYIRCPSVRN